MRANIEGGEQALTGWLEAIIESADDAIMSKTLDGILTSWNKAAENIFGYTADEAVGKPVLMLIPDDLRDEEAMILGKIRAGQRIEHYETTRVAKDGRRITVSLSVSPIKGADGTIVGASKILRDITRQKQIEEERDALLKREQAAREQAELSGDRGRHYDVADIGAHTWRDHRLEQVFDPAVADQRAHVHRERRAAATE